MAIRKTSNGRPQIVQVSPPAAIAGGELQIRGKGFARSDRPRVTIGDVSAPVVIGSDSFVIVKVPEGASAGELVVESGDLSSQVWTCDIGRALRAAHAIEAGWVQVNQGLGQSPGHSYGGVKQSGIGREFSLEGMLDSFTQRKNVTVNLAV